MWQAERFVCLLSEVPNLQGRIEGFLTREKYDGRYSDLRKRVQIVRDACRAVRSPAALVELNRVPHHVYRCPSIRRIQMRLDYL